MTLKNRIYISAFILLIFLTYTIFNPTDGEIETLKASDFSLEKFNINKENKWSQLRDDRNGRFFIHPGERNPTKAVFTFKRDLEIHLEYSIRDSSKIGEIEFTTNLNNKEKSKNLVTPEKPAYILIRVSTGDKLAIYADKFNRTTSDHGNIQINTKISSSAQEKITITLIWAIFILFLYKQGYPYTAINSYALFTLLIIAEKSYLGPITFNSIVSYTLIIFSIVFFIILLEQLPRYKNHNTYLFPLHYLATISLSVIPFALFIYTLNINEHLTKDTFYAIFQTNIVESYEFISDHISTLTILLFIPLAIIPAYILQKENRSTTLSTDTITIILIITIILATPSSNIQNLRIVDFISSSIQQYNRELNAFKEIQTKRNDKEIKFKASKIKTGETYVIILGESLNKNHMSLYGYFRDTTPNLKRLKESDELVTFTNVYSNHTHTVPVMSLSLTEANQYNNKDYFDSLSIVQILNKASFETHWLTNQTIYGPWDNLISVIAASSNNLVAINKSIGKQTKTQKYDGSLIKEVKNILSTETNKNRVIFVHLMGSHGSYKSRYPSESFTNFRDTPSIADFGPIVSEIQNLNDYDNSVFYNDYVVSSILSELKKSNPKKASALLYVSDHADDVFGRKAHNSAQFTFNMTQTPMIAWFNNKYKNLYSSKHDHLLKNKDKLFSNDLLFDTLIGFFDINTQHYDPKYDLTSYKYTLEENSALTLHGKKKYIDRDNQIFWQKKNINHLTTNKLDNRILPHRVNSIGKLNEIWNDGFRSFEVDIRFGDNETKQFLVGHDRKRTGKDLNIFLNAIPHKEIKRIWFDFKNLNQDNYLDALKSLNMLDKKYNLKEKVILESGITSKIFEEFSKAGWHTSYYLPTGKINNLLTEQDEKGLTHLALKILKQSKDQKLSAISFDSSNAAFVKNHLEHKLTDDINYHIWYGPDLYDPNFKSKISKSELFSDTRVTTILSKYSSYFNL